MLKEIQEEIGIINAKIKKLKKQLEFLEDEKKFLTDKLIELTPPCVNDKCDWFDEDATNNCIFHGTHFKCPKYIPAFKYEEDNL